MGKSVPHILKIVVCAALLAVTGYSIFLRIHVLSAGVWLWDDEAMLALNILPQGIASLLTPPLAMHQNAPMLYLAAVKALTGLFGTGEAALRLYSLIAFAGFAVCFALLLRNAFRFSAVYVCAAVAAVSTFVVYIRYSLEVKPYMGDVFCIFLLLLLYRYYKDGRIRLILFAAIGAVCLFLSSPLIFFLGGILVFELVQRLRQARQTRDFRPVLAVCVCGVFLLAVFAANYFYWMKPTMNDAYMVDFWEGNRFRIRFWDFSALKHDLVVLRYELLEFIPFQNGLTVFWFFLAPAGFVISLIRKNIYTLVIGVSVLLMLIASGLGFYPVSLRLMLFLYAFAFLYSFVFIEAVSAQGFPDRPRRQKISRIVLQAVLTLMILAGNYTFLRADDPDRENLGAWDKGMRVQPLAEYVNDHIREGETVYSYFMATNILQYQLRYANEKIPNLRESDFIFGSIDMKGDASEIAHRENGVYLLFDNSYFPVKQDTMIYDLMADLDKEGYLDRVAEVNFTPLYWFAKDLGALKTGAAMEVLPQTADGQMTVHITNTGETYLETFASRNPFRTLLYRHGLEDRRGAVEIVGRLYEEGVLTGERVLAPLPYALAPGEQCDVSFFLGDPGGADQISIELVSEGRFDFSRIGTAPIVLPVP